nr:unnamed protein product [Digitaria exilis]
MDLLRYMAPVAIILLVPATLIMEHGRTGSCAGDAHVVVQELVALCKDTCRSSAAAFVAGGAFGALWRAFVAHQIKCLVFLLIVGQSAVPTVTLAREDPNFIWILLCNSSMAYFVNLTNFLVTKHTSALTLQVIHLPLLRCSTICAADY